LEASGFDHVDFRFAPIRFLNIPSLIEIYFIDGKSLKSINPFSKLKTLKPLILILILFSYSLHVRSQEKGKASYYADKFEGKSTASGQIYHHHLKTAAHPTLPFGTFVKVTNIRNNKTVVVIINDRGPFAKGRIIDLSKSAAREIGGIRLGIFEVEVEVFPDIAPLWEKEEIKKG